MGILAPLFLAGLAALSVPLVLHLIRRTPQGRQAFGSLMFLAPSAPRITRRSRLDQLLLLLLRIGAITLLVIAFTRPFLRESALITLTDLPGRRVAILLDTSGSMQQQGLWPQAIAEVESVLQNLAPQDSVAFYTFGDRLQTHLPFSSLSSGDPAASSAAASSNIAAGNSAAGNSTAGAAQGSTAPGATFSSSALAVRRLLPGLSPSWESSQLDTAVVAVASEMQTLQDPNQSPTAAQLVVISDFQESVRLDALEGYQWPEHIQLLPRRIGPKQPTNASLSILSANPAVASDTLRVRVTNAANSQGEQFYLVWETTDTWAPDSSETSATSATAAQAGSDSQSSTALHSLEPVPVHVPAGESRVIEMPRPVGADRLLLTGDDQKFDNRFFVVPQQVIPVTIGFVGEEATSDPHDPLYYLRLATEYDPLHPANFQQVTSAESLRLPNGQLLDLVLATTAIADQLRPELQEYVTSGGTLLLVPNSTVAAANHLQWIPEASLTATVDNQAAATDDYLLLGQIDFTHPLFLPFASPQFSDFTKIHFWQHFAVQLPDASQATVLARFDNRDPYILELSLGSGQLLLFTSPWQPEASQWSISSKFVPMLSSLLESVSGVQTTASSLVVGQGIALQPSQLPATVSREGAILAELTSENPRFTQTDRPGIYQVTTTAVNTAASAANADSALSSNWEPQRWLYAVNLAASESQTAPLDLQQLEQYGVQLDQGLSRTAELSLARQQRDIELESRQKVWQWLIVACLIVLLIEIVYSGLLAKRQIPVLGATP